MNRLNMYPSLNSFSIEIKMEEIKLPPFDEILVLGKNSSHGKMGIMKSFELFAPNGFEMIEVDHLLVDAVFVNRRILNKITKPAVLKILEDRIFPFISEGELLKVDFKITIIQKFSEEVAEK